MPASYAPTNVISPHDGLGFRGGQRFHGAGEIRQGDGGFRGLVPFRDHQVERYVPAGSRVCADSARCYTLLLALGYQVEQVNHGAGEYARGDVHENTAECEIGLLKQFLLAHRGISMATLPSYLKLHQFRRNERGRSYREQACLLLAGLLGQGPGPRCLLPVAWAHRRDACEVWRPPREKAEEGVPALAA
jgi:hypothetical protein